MRYNTSIQINEREISIDSPTYFIADIAANHDGDLQRAKDLIWLAKESGADAAKFQHFRAEKIVSDVGFKTLGTQVGHQSKWKKSVFEIYRQYECDRTWTEELVKTANEAKIDFFTAAYDYEALDLLDRFLPAYKIGSGDVTWTEFIEVVAAKGKPVLLATGASSMKDVEMAVDACLKHNRQFLLMQCNTNYTGSLENFKYVNLKVLQTFAIRYPGMLLGLSDHTPGHATVLGAIALGARAIEKHFTDDNNREGPDHGFAMNPRTWKEMVERSRELQASLGSGIKQIEDNEKDTVVLQRRCVRVTRDLKAGEILGADDLECLRPAPLNAFSPYQLGNILGKPLKLTRKKGEALLVEDVEV